MSDLAQTHTWRPPSPTVLCRLCKANYVDDPEGRQAHRVVFGHTPGDEEPPAQEGGGDGD